MNVQNANSKLKAVALGQTYFAVQNREMELTEEEYGKLTKDEKDCIEEKNQMNKLPLIHIIKW